MDQQRPAAPRARRARDVAAGLAVIATLIAVPGAALRAHHSIAGAYDAARPIRLDGTVRQFRFVNPHPWIELEAPDARGRLLVWRLELDNRYELAAIGMSAGTLRTGDRLVVSGSASRSVEQALYVRAFDRPADGLHYEQVGYRPVLSGVGGSTR